MVNEFLFKLSLTDAGCQAAQKLENIRVFNDLVAKSDCGAGKVAAKLVVALPRRA